MKILLINAFFGHGSTGKIVKSIAEDVTIDGKNSVFILYGYGTKTEKYTFFKTIKSESLIWNKINILKGAINGFNGFTNKRRTKLALDFCKKTNPDIINLHVSHGNWIDSKILLDGLKKLNKPIVLTLHDCWYFTGHCPHFYMFGCTNYKTECKNCEFLKQITYPKAYFFDRSNEQFKLKKEMFDYDKLFLVGPCRWILDRANESKILRGHKSFVINNGIDFYKIKSEIHNEFSYIMMNNRSKKVLLGVSNKWTHSKGYDEFIELSKCISDDYLIVLVGNYDKKLNIPNIVQIKKTDNQAQLKYIYENSYCFINPTLADTFPTTNIEALQSGLPLIVYNTGGCPELKNGKIVNVVEHNDPQSIVKCLKNIEKNRTVVLDYGMNFTVEKMTDKYFKLFKRLTDEK